jgi:hypothetical protein
MASTSKAVVRHRKDSNARDAGARIGDAILGFVGNVPASARRKSKSAEADARQAIAAAAARASLAAGTLSLPPGPFGWLTMLPELVAVWKIQAQLVADIAALHGRKSVLTREAMLYCLFRHTAAQALRDIVVQAGAQILVKPATIQVLQKVAGVIGLKIGQRTLGKAFTRWLPIVGAVGVAAYAYYDTVQVGTTSLGFFADKPGKAQADIATRD